MKYTGRLTLLVTPCSPVLVVRGLSVSLPSMLEAGALSAEDRKLQLNAVKMGVFLLCKFTETLESDSYRQSIVTAPSKVSHSKHSCHFAFFEHYIVALNRWAGCREIMPCDET